VPHTFLFEEGTWKVEGEHRDAAGAVSCPDSLKRCTACTSNCAWWRKLAAAAAKLVTLRRAPFATGRPVCPLRRVEADLIIFFTSRNLSSLLE